ncbi:MAG: DUF429 domain-containing protein [Candidatus Dormibacteria bacterium]
MASDRVVVGVDVSKGAWVAVTLRNGRFGSATVRREVETVADDTVAVIGVDIPVGLPVLGRRRQADVLARTRIGRHASSVFPTASAAEFEADDHAAAVAVARAAGHAAMSAQTWGLRRAINDMAALAARDGRVHEVHPEVSFAAMAQRPLVWGKKSWNGSQERRGLLRAHGIDVPDSLPDVGSAAVDDVLDAAAAAWSADRIARGVAESLPSPPEIIDGRAVAIWA